MSILYDEAQEAIASEARRVLEGDADPAGQLRLLETTGQFDERFWNRAVELGWPAVAVPEDHGGLGLGLIELGLIVQAAGSVIAGAPFLTTNYGAVRLLLAAGNEAAKAQWLPRLAAGEAIGAVCLSGKHAPLPAQPDATFSNGMLEGTVHAVAAGLGADFAIVWARSARGPALVLVELASVSRKPVASFDNSRLYADMVFVNAPAVLLLEGEAARAAALDTLARMAVVTAHEQTGGAEAAMLAARDYALTRKAFGQPIGAFQSVKHRIAELYGLVEIARANCIHAASREGEADFLVAAASARLSATEAYDTASRDMVQIHGGVGVAWESGLHLHLRRARSLAIEHGNGLFWEDLLTTELTGVAP